MSGHRGGARSGKIKAKARVMFHDTGRTVTSNVFISVYDDALAVVERIEAKYSKHLTVVSLKAGGRTGYALFERIAA